jgi:hypothetical protein
VSLWQVLARIALNEAEFLRVLRDVVQLFQTDRWVACSRQA